MTALGQGPGPAPGQGLGPAPGQGLGPAPGQGLGSAPGQGLGQVISAQTQGLECVSRERMDRMSEMGMMATEQCHSTVLVGVMTCLDLLQHAQKVLDVWQHHGYQQQKQQQQVITLSLQIRFIF